MKQPDRGRDFVRSSSYVVGQQQDIQHMRFTPSGGNDGRSILDTDRSRVALRCFRVHRSFLVVCRDTVTEGGGFLK
jgi:hypothetical protein